MATDPRPYPDEPGDPGELPPEQPFTIPPPTADGLHHDNYDPAVLDVVLGEAAHLLRALGFAAKHAVLIGGVVPSLLILDPPGPRHVGTGDLDLCLSLALVDGDTAEYERIETALTKAGYQPTDASFRWHRRGVQVEFFCPAGPNRPAGRAFRPKAADNPTAKHNMGPKLTALALDAGDLISLDTLTVTRQVTLPDDAGVTTTTFTICGLVAFLAAKTAALTERDKPKDAYDIVWVLENWLGGPTQAAEAIHDNPVSEHPHAVEALRRLFDAFAAPDRVGPRSYARFLASEGATRDERLRLTRQAAGAVNELRAALGRD